MKNILNKMSSSMAVNTIGCIVILLIVFGTVTSSLGYMIFSSSFKEEYATSTYHMADTAAALVNGDHIEAYLNGDEQEEYKQTKAYLDAYCKKMSVSLIYVIDVDTSDYGRFVSVFNLIDNSVGNTEYTEWELGHKRDTTNDEYRKKYKALYEQGSDYETVYRANPGKGQHPHITTLVPVRSSDGDTAAILCIQRPMSELNEARKPYLIIIAISTFLTAVIAVIIAVIYIRRLIVAPIKKVSEEAARFASENTKGEPLSSVSRFREITELADSVDTMETDMVRYIEDVTALTAEQERIGTEFKLAANIQEAMLPGVFSPFPDRNEFEIYASMDPAKAVGGDFYDFFLVDDDHLCMVIADVSGKGVPAALFMMAAKIVIADNAMMGKSPARILTDANAYICANNHTEMFLTVWLGILEISTGRLTAANAGHEYPVLRTPGGRYELYRDKHGFVIGGMEGIAYKEYELMLEPGSRLFVYTDGVPEATDKDGNMFTTDRMISALNSDSQADIKKTLRIVRRAVDGFVKDAEQFDDLTMLCLEYKERKND